jgi:hypothetical protein
LETLGDDASNVFSGADSGLAASGLAVGIADIALPSMQPVSAPLFSIEAEQLGWLHSSKCVSPPLSAFSRPLARLKQLAMLELGVQAT